MEISTRRALGGALAGAGAATLWAVQQPLDQLVFRSRYDDVELLGKIATRGRAWPVAGLAMHAGNRRALAQAIWRHGLFGLALGALEARINGRIPSAERPATTGRHA